MPRGDKSKYTDKQKRQAEHIAEGYEDRGVPEQRGQAAGVGHGEQGDRGRQQVRQRPGQARYQGLQQEGRRDRRQEGRGRLGRALARAAFRLGEEGGRDPQAQPPGQGALIAGDLV